ncbi:response regulator transcription factor [Paraburkholderia sp. DHOC27]|uniref:response regulator transcription factor n=1 Tax=Paraburkholderia sp. DHOC27 TaxID=2303330 RepID=UPI000E3BF8F6|nr:response regulator transcription factor [Paraburkholderia sp. DHOC27]RFU47040.1 DNA-binding response regulator [Paraburkholderia sp. DHOC27]
MLEYAELSTPVRVIIADDHPLVLFAIESLMSVHPNVQIVGHAADCSELFAQADQTEFDLAVMDLYMSSDDELDGIESVKQFKRRYPGTPLVVLTMETDAGTLQKVLTLGVDALMSKRDRIDLIHVAIVTALAHECYIGPAVLKLIADAAVGRRFEFVRELLTPRELEVLTQYASGVGVTEIAMRLGRSVKTVSAQKCTAMRKLALHSDSELFRFAVDHGVLTEDGREARGESHPPQT